MRHLVLSLLLATAVEAQDLTIKRPDGTSTTITAAQRATLPRITGRATFHDAPVLYEGHDLRDVLRLAGVSADSLRGPALRRVVILVGADGYAASISLSDLDPNIGARQAVLVDREDNAPLPADRGPLRIIVVGDKRPTRWVRQVVRIEIVDVR